MSVVLLARKAWMPKCFTPYAFNFRNASFICSLVMPYLASLGVSMMALFRVKSPPGL